MNKAELIAAVAAAAEISKKDAETAVSATLDAITAAPAVTPVPRKLSRSPLPRCPCSRPARL